MQRRPAILTHGEAVLALLLVLLVGLLAAPAAAFAREYSIPWVRIYATLQADGTLEVTEDRTYDFNGEYHGVYWDLSRDGGEGSDLAIAVHSCGIVSGSDYSTFEQSDSNSDGTYTVSDTTNDDGTPITRVTLYSTNEDVQTIFRIVYTATGVATRYSDVGELYWKFVSDGWEVPSENVVCTVDLPVPLAEKISVGDNVRVWAHDPLSGTITTGGDRVRATVPSVSSGEYAELRVTMPFAWLLDMDTVGEERLDTILQEEKGWAEETNARRTQARIIGASMRLFPRENYLKKIRGFYLQAN